MLIVIEMNVWATVQRIAIAIDRRRPSGRMEMKEGAGARPPPRSMRGLPLALMSGESRWRGRGNGKKRLKKTETGV